MTESSDTSDRGGGDNVGAIISSGADIAGAAVGGALGFLAAVPFGAAAGGASGVAAAQALRSIGQEVAERLLSPREKVRVGGALAIAASKIQERLKRGENLRQDDFFDPKLNGRSDADEIAESALLKCQREAEERKVPYIAYLIGNIAFDAQISSGLAHQIVKTAEALTYRQLCIIKIAALKGNFPLRAVYYRGQQKFEKRLYELLYESLDLYHRALINFEGEVAFGPTDVKPASITVQGMGVDLFNQMES